MSKSQLGEMAGLEKAGEYKEFPTPNVTFHKAWVPLLHRLMIQGRATEILIHRGAQTQTHVNSPADIRVIRRSMKSYQHETARDLFPAP